MQEQAAFVTSFVTAQDGLRLCVRDYGPRAGARLPVVCLPGLTRTSADFHALASALSAPANGGRRVLALDYRGRGGSDYDVDPRNYTIAVEIGDVIAVLTACAAAPAVLVGTSRGGLIIMGLAAVQPTLIAGAVLNDIGPVIETEGLLRIKSYVGRMAQPANFEEGAAILRRLFGGQFPALGPADWMAWAQRSWKTQGDRLVETYDAKLATTLSAVDLEHPLPHLWPQFDALAGVPLMVVRGANSDILSAETVRAMRQRREKLTAVEVADQGHAPLLAEPDICQRIADFAAACDESRNA
jgi:pimeloyl-ACP methyl ester carboxylesterase